MRGDTDVSFEPKEDARLSAPLVLPSRPQRNKLSHRFEQEVLLQGNFSCVLIAGTSHTGKTTLAQELSQTLDWTLLSTDRLARHPGRPWPEVRQPVAEYYSALSDETIYWFLRVHHENMRSALLQKIDDAQNAKMPLVLEGSALRPEYVATRMTTETVGVCLYSDETFLRDRMRFESQHASCDQERRTIIDKFIDRSLRDNMEIHASAKAHGLVCVDISKVGAVEQLREDLTRGAR
jgi:2-phosphoglycerate kinase